MLAVKKQMYYKGKIYSSVGNKILVQNVNGSKPSTYLRISELSFLNYSQLYNRLLRHGIHSFYKINNSIDCVVIKGRILFYRNKQLLSSVILENGSRPLRQGIAYYPDHIIYSEYYGNKNREPVHIYKYDFLNKKREILYTFNDIRHIHFIQRSKENPNLMLIATGDLDHECGIYKFNPNLGEMKKLGGGSQTWRAVSVLETSTGLIWGTDDPENQNYLMKLETHNSKLKKLRKIAGPAYYSATTLGGEMYIATTVENRKKHKAMIYMSKDGETWRVYKEFRKDVFHTKYFGYGVVEFVNNQQRLDGPVVYNKVGLVL